MICCTTVQYANLIGKYIVTGTTNEQAIEQVIGSGMDISKSIVGVYNPFTRQNAVLAVDPYLRKKSRFEESPEKQ